MYCVVTFPNRLNDYPMMYLYWTQQLWIGGYEYVRVNEETK